MRRHEPHRARHRGAPRCPSCEKHLPFVIVSETVKHQNGIPAILVQCCECATQWWTRSQDVVDPIVEKQREERLRRAVGP